MLGKSGHGKVQALPSRAVSEEYRTFYDREETGEFSIGWATQGMLWGGGQTGNSSGKSEEDDKAEEKRNSSFGG